MREFHNKHRGETCVVIGNGPSLDKTSLDFDCATFGSNMIFRKPYIPTYYVCVDREMCQAIDAWPDTTCFIRAEYARGEHPLYPIVVNGFSVAPDNFVVIGGTVTYVMLQLAFYMGFQRVYLVGVDHNYPKAGRLTPGSRFTAGSNDPDHFTPDDGKPYFEKGKVFNAPEVSETTRYYKIAKDIYNQAGRQIINLTPGTKLDVFDKGELWQIAH